KHHSHSKKNRKEAIEASPPAVVLLPPTTPPVPIIARDPQTEFNVEPLKTATDVEYEFCPNINPEEIIEIPNGRY
ncbi:hypothetical protein OESDEN_08246, partial [Oesophagostomum dentatum]